MHWIFDVVVGAALLVLGYILGGTAAFYKGWDEGFREGFHREIAERPGSMKMTAGKNAPDSGRKDFPVRKAS